MRKSIKKFLSKLVVGAMVLSMAAGLGQPATAKAATDRLTLSKFTTAPVIDGKVDESEWGTPVFKVKDGEENITILDQNGVFPGDFEADVYMGYDNKHIYIAAVAEYDIHKNEALLPTDIWQGDCLQIQISSTVGTDRNELGFTYNSLTKKQQAVAWASTGTFNMEGGEGKDFIVYRDGTKTIYEIALGVEQFSNLTELADGMTLPFSCAFTMSGGGFLEYCSGIVSAKDITKAGLIGLGVAPDENAAPPAVDPNAVNVNNNLLDSKAATGNRAVPGVIEAEDYDELYGTEIRIEESCPDGTSNLGFTSDRDYMVYKNVNFASVPDGINLRVSGTGAPVVQVRLDKVDGTKIAEVKVTPSGDWGTYVTVSGEMMNTEDIVGTHDVYVLINGGMNINWIEFTGAAASVPTASTAVTPEKDRLVLGKFGTAPSIDGKVDESEWGAPVFTVKDGEPSITILDNNGVFPGAFTADVYMGYDNKHVYIAAVAEYDIHKNEALLPTDIWQGDCLQIQISGTVGTDRNELGFTYNSLTKKQQAVAWASTGTFNMEGGEGKDFIVYRDGTKTIYEIALGVEQFSNLTELADGMTLPFSCAFTMSGGGFLEYCSGIVSAKDITKAGLIGLGVAPDENAAPPAVENPDAVNVNNNLLDSRTETGNRAVPGVIEAEDYNELYGTEIHTGACPDGTDNLGWTANGDYMVYKNVNFTSVPDGINLRVSGTGEPVVQVRLDKVDGTKIAEIKVTASGNWDSYITVSGELMNTEGIVGTHDVYVLINGGMNLNWIEFTGTQASVEPTPEPTVEPTPEPTAEPTVAPTEAPTPTEVPVATPDDTKDNTQTSAPTTENEGNNTVIIIIAVIAVIAIAAVAVVVMKKKKSAK